MNALKDLVKRRRRVPELVSINVAEDEVAEGRVLAAWGESVEPRIQVLREAMCTLTPKQRHLIEWKYGDGLTYREIAPRLGITQAAVSQALRRARLSLKRAIEKEEITSDDA